MVRRLNGPKGLGDAIYLRALVLHLLAAGDTVEVYTSWPEVFVGLPITVERADGYGDYGTLTHMTACMNCQVPHIARLDKFTLACLQAGVSDPVELKLDWKVRNAALINDIVKRSDGRKIFLFQPLKIAHNIEQVLIAPHRLAYRKFVSDKSDHFRVKVGSPEFIEANDHPPSDYDLVGRTSVGDVFDIATHADLVFGDLNYLHILAQALDRRFVIMCSRRGLASNIKRVAGMRPDRFIQKPHLGHAILDE